MCMQVLVHTGVSNYIEFKPVDGSFVYSSKAGKICKVPASCAREQRPRAAPAVAAARPRLLCARPRLPPVRGRAWLRRRRLPYPRAASHSSQVPSTPEDATKSSLMSMMEKTRMMQFTLWVSKVNLADRKTWVAGMMTKKRVSTTRASTTRGCSRDAEHRSPHAALLRSLKKRRPPLAACRRSPLAAARRLLPRCALTRSGRVCRVIAPPGGASSALTRALRTRSTPPQLELDTITGKEFFKYWALEQATIDFLTHATCLYRDESWATQPAIEVVKRMQVRVRPLSANCRRHPTQAPRQRRRLLANGAASPRPPPLPRLPATSAPPRPTQRESLAAHTPRPSQLYLESKTRFAGMTSPYLYPLYGLGELPQVG